MVCGDDKGKIWTYHIPNLQKNSFHTGKPILPTEVSVFSDSSFLLRFLFREISIVFLFFFFSKNESIKLVWEVVAVRQNKLSD